MNSKTGFKNSQKGLYNNILPPPPRFCNSVISGVWGIFEFNSSADCNAQIIASLACAQDSARQLGSGAEHKTAKEPVESENNKLFEQASSKPSKIVQIPKQVRNDDFSLVNENNNKASCHPEFISGSYQSCDSTHSRSDSEHTSQNAKELLEEGNNNKINCNIHRASGRVCLLLPLSCGETCKMASRLHYNIANTHCSFNSELGQSRTPLTRYK